MSEEFLPLRIYRNLKKFITYRRLTLINHPQTQTNKWLDDDEFMDNIYNDEYILLECEDNYERQIETLTYIYLFNIESKYKNESAEIKKLIKKTPGYKAGHDIDILLVSKNPYDIHRSKSARGMANETTSIEFVLYRDLISSPFDHHLVQLHEIMSKEEVDEVLEWFRMDVNDLPKIKKSERMMIWLNPNIGDIIRISGTGDTGDVISYRLVI